MNEREFYDYIIEHYNLDGTASRLLHNIIEYVEDFQFVDAEDSHRHLTALLDGAFGIEEYDIRLFHAPTCWKCGDYIETYGDSLCCCCEEEDANATR